MLCLETDTTTGATTVNLYLENNPDALRRYAAQFTTRVDEAIDAARETIDDDDCIGTVYAKVFQATLSHRMNYETFAWIETMLERGDVGFEDAKTPEELASFLSLNMVSEIYEDTGLSPDYDYIDMMNVDWLMVALAVKRERAAA